MGFKECLFFSLPAATTILAPMAQEAWNMSQQQRQDSEAGTTVPPETLF